MIYSVGASTDHTSPKAHEGVKAKRLVESIREAELEGFIVQFGFSFYA
ncbi:hypothetical protein MUN89_13415 [Halobacillus salinarum]|uniref:Uncharacterized protein n=1 Tax=Halobacillus salinarum TaxID=2932257 RepID=A0ABY4EEQ7_9BACI|nr:hypothetical protein [Halobacillus salinarum]UOQ42951.1 hypothetical protein MUN89_13415 [Halobacillus salinarum]